MEMSEGEAIMLVQERVWDIDGLLWLMRQPGNEGKRYELINGELLEMSPVNETLGYLAGRMVRFLSEFCDEHEMGIAAVETGYYDLDDETTLLGPDVAFRRTDRGPREPYDSFVPRFPDLAVEIKSPSDSMAQLRRKAALFLERGTALVWIVIPDEKAVEVHRRAADGGVETIGLDGSLSGEGVLPGFALALETLFK